MKKILLLNSTNEMLHFINEKKAIKLLFKNKVDVVSTWDDCSFLMCGESIKLPAILKLRYYVFKPHKQLPFSKKSVFRRDDYSCLYCGKYLKQGFATIDHIVPKSLGGRSSFKNCATSCFRCNARKGNKTPEQACMQLLKEPIIPSGYIFYFGEGENRHKDWEKFIKII